MPFLRELRNIIVPLIMYGKQMKDNLQISEVHVIFSLACLLIIFLLLFVPVIFVKPVSPLSQASTKTAVLGAADQMRFLPTVTSFPINHPPKAKPAGELFVQTGFSATQPTTTIPATVTTIVKPLSQKSYSIAIIGDSMVDTMGERLEYLEHSLKKISPSTSFHLYNYGIGGENVGEGVARFSSPFHFRDRTYPALPQVHPDYLIIGSFSYNPFNPYDRNKHWLGLKQLVESAKTVSPHVYVLAEIAPLIHDFGKGPGGINWSDPAIHVGHIIEQLQNAEGIAKVENVGLIDAFAKSQINSQHEGNKIYVDPNDNIHPSIAGHEFIANLIANTLF